MNFIFQIKTPLWTGGVEPGRMDRIHETNIIGALRWWYEAIVRGLGGDVCNPTSDNSAERCLPDDRGYCDVCEIFGATGKRRTFRLRMGAGTSLFDNSLGSIPLPSGRIHEMRNNRLRAGGWYLMRESMTGEAIPMKIIPLSSVDVGSHLRPVLALIDRHAALGAKVSNGYGVVNVRENDQCIQIGNEGLTALQQARLHPPREHTLPDIRDFFFAKIRFEEPSGDSNWWQRIQGITDALKGQVTDENGHTVNVYHRNTIKNTEHRKQAHEHLQTLFQNGLLPLAPAVRNWLRYHWNSDLTDCQKHYLFGEAQPVCPHCCQKGFREDRKNRRNNWCPNCKRTFPKGGEFPETASKINVSHAYRLESGQWELRVWGWIPCQTPQGLSLDRDDFLKDLRDTLENASIWQWIFNANQPTPEVTEWHVLPCDQTDGVAYLKELLGLEEGGAQ